MDTIRRFFAKLFRKFADVLDKEPEKKLPPYTPKTLEDLLGVLKRTPSAVLTYGQRNIIASAMSFADTSVKSVMQKKSQVTFVYEHDFLGPLMLDKLYRSGSSHFPVLDSASHIVGVLHTESLNSLEIKKTDRASKYLDKHVYFIRQDYSLSQAFAAFLRTNCYFLIVINRQEELVGIITLEQIIEHLLGYVPSDNFDNDASSYAVSKR